MNLPRPPAWMADALCAQVGDHDLFFGDKGSTPADAISICRACPVRDTCLTWAIDNHLYHGVFGGRTARQRYYDRKEPA